MSTETLTRPRFKKFGTRYPWERWFARKRFTLTRGFEYTCRTDSMAQQVRFAADRLGVKLRFGEGVVVSEDGQRITVTVNGAKNAANTKAVSA